MRRLQSRRYGGFATSRRGSEGRKIESDVLVLFSKGYLGGRHDVEKVWSEWTRQSGKLEVHGIERGVGHFVAEEEPEETARVVRSLYERHV
jgi:pimeloyl-ACP methyl ester carboxylesterase